ncbi:MAG: hypothetical protein ACRDHZ_25425 [Ktedonobacteraceae bacterium]
MTVLPLSFSGFLLANNIASSGSVVQQHFESYIRKKFAYFGTTRSGVFIGVHVRPSSVYCCPFNGVGWLFVTYPCSGRGWKD